MLNPIIIDTETTGLKAPQAIEVAYITLPTLLEKIKDKFNLKPDLSLDLDLNLNLTSISDSETGIYRERFLPSKPIDPYATKVHGIYYEDLEGCRPSEEFILPEHNCFIAHNAAFDHRVLGKPKTNLVCTQKLAKIAFDKDYQDGELRNFKLVTLIDHILPDEVSKPLLESAHGALGDCIMTWYLLIEIINRMPHISSWDSFIQLSLPVKKTKNKLVRMPFGKYKGIKIADVPLDYLRWLLDQDISHNLRSAILPLLPPSDSSP